MSKTPNYTNQEWAQARNYLRSLNLQIDEAGAIALGQAEVFVTNPVAAKALEIFLTPSQFEQRMDQYFKQAGDLIDRLLDHSMIEHYLFLNVCQMNDLAIQRYHERSESFFLRFIKQLRALVAHLDKIEYQQSKEKEIAYG